MPQLICMNKETGDLAVCIPVEFANKWSRRIASPLNYEITLKYNDVDGYICQVKDSAWVYVCADYFLKNTEILDEL